MRTLILIWLALLSACGGGGNSGGTAATNTATPTTTPSAPPIQSPLDETLRNVIEQEGLMGDASFNRTLPTIESPLAQLGMRLFFSKALGGELDSACVSCHHPALGGADGLSLPVGVGAQNPDLLGQGRIDADSVPDVPRNSPTVFNAGLWDSGMFWDSRIESFGKETFANGSVSDIRTPDVPFGTADAAAGPNLGTAQARFPVTSAEEMRGAFEAGATSAALRDHLADRLAERGDHEGVIISNNWLIAFQEAFASTANADELITFDNIALALAEYERSMTFTSNPFADYVSGDIDALTEEQKEGAVLFLTSVEEGGAGCASCHKGDRFTDELHHLIAFPQIGPGKG